MQDLLNFLQSHGFVVPDLKCNGKIIRFDIDGKKNNGWFIGWENFTHGSGKAYIIAEVGNWSTEERFEYRTDISYSTEDLALIKKKRQAAAKAHEEETKKVNEETAREAEKIWNEASPTGHSAYVEKKHLGGLHGARIKESPGRGTELLVPARDIDGKMWGLQRIYADSSKYFLAGQKKVGCFHQIGGEIVGHKPLIYIAEGFATAASIHIATGVPTIVAFDAGNLEAVGRAIRDRYRNARIIYCADNDRFRETNIGVEKATAAARRVGAKVIVPVFQSDLGKPTDFNDLQMVEGIEAVRTQLKELPPEEFVLALGYCDDKFYYTSSQNLQVVELGVSQHSQLHFLSLMKLEYWESRYEEKKGVVAWAKAASALMDECREKGVFDPHKIRGSGGWSESDGKLVLNLGDRLFCDGCEMALSEIESESIYTLAETIPTPLFPSLSDSESRNLLGLIEGFNWKHPKYPKFLAGYLAVAPFCGALKWRPHLWITGPSGSGKSSLFDYLVRPLVGGFGESVGGNSTDRKSVV